MGNHKTRGFTVFETLLSLILLVGVLAGTAMIVRRGFALFHTSSASGDINARGTRALDRVARELRGAGIGTIQQDLVTPAGMDKFWSPQLDYRLALDWAAGAVVWSPDKRLVLELETGEVANDIDDNGNGLVDEGKLVLLENPGLATERRVVLANGVSELLEGELPNGVDDNGNEIVDEAGLCFDREGNVLTVRLSLERVGPNGDVLVRTQRDSIIIRN